VKEKNLPYPTDFEEFIDWFSQESDCETYLEKLRWPDGFQCPQCGGTNAWKTERSLWHCGQCSRQTSVRSGTVFDGSRKPLRLWFHVAWLMMSQKTGLSARTLCDTFGFGSYQTAWGWLHKYRSVMIRQGREQLQDRVEINEAYIGGVKAGKRGRGAEGKTMVLVAVEGAKNAPQRVRFRCVPSAQKGCLLEFVQDYVSPGATIVTDGLMVYKGLQGAGFQHERHVNSGDLEAMDHVGHVHLVVSLLKRWLDGTHHGAIRSSHLQSYLDEFAFRFNRRLSTHRGKLFYRLMQQSVTARPPGIKDFYQTSQHRN
jgi:transposase-like protein